jgi:hypothetical protein
MNLSAIGSYTVNYTPGVYNQTPRARGIESQISALLDRISNLERSELDQDSKAAQIELLESRLAALERQLESSNPEANTEQAFSFSEPASSYANNPSSQDYRSLYGDGFTDPVLGYANAQGSLNVVYGSSGNSNALNRETGNLIAYA